MKYWIVPELFAGNQGTKVKGLLNLIGDRIDKTWVNCFTVTVPFSVNEGILYFCRSLQLSHPE